MQSGFQQGSLLGGPPLQDYREGFAVEITWEEVCMRLRLNAS